MVILNRSINLAVERELVEDVLGQAIADKSPDFYETFWRIHQGYVKNLEGEEIRVTDREVFNLVD